ncbi:MAG TPA: PEP/pyruvate-binding domain-containing protein [Phycisphaerae bacterium]|nr:PEP/pyruvate-binding domain-containing protein [Phycisphaerae bacterium]
MFPRFDRQSALAGAEITVIGAGELGGKALGLASAQRIVAQACPEGSFPQVTIGIPRLTVIATDVFERFVADNGLDRLAFDELSDERIAHAFLNASLPPLIVGDLRALAAGARVPLAVRSSSLLEDALDHPFAGVYATKMIPNNAASVDERSRKLGEAVKFVWASTFFADARSYLRMIRRPAGSERMAVVIQEVVGEAYDERFYPIVSGVARTHSFYPTGGARGDEGVVNLALGLGKTIVDGGVTWSYCPKYPGQPPPYASARELLHNTQTRFWAVNLGNIPYDPVNEAECLVACGLDAAEWDDVLRFTASTYDPAADRLTLGVGRPGPRALTFAPLLELGDVPVNAIVERLLAACRAELGAEVEIEFAVTFDRRGGLPARFGFLQVRPMLVGGAQVDVTAEALADPRALVASGSVLGNGADATLADVIYVRPEAFEARHTPAIATELAAWNARLAAEDRPYVLIGFGRWGSSDPWLGIPVTWPQIAQARVIVEATRPDMDVDASQGSHFFHNLISFQVFYFTVPHSAAGTIAWAWLDAQPAIAESALLRHVRLAAPLSVRVDGRSSRGVILHE